MSNPTTPFNWQMPTNTDLVTNLPADFEVFGQAVATSMGDLLGGTTGQILSKATNADMDFTWITNDIGDITAVTAGSGLSGGGTSGAVSLALDLTSANVFTAAQTATQFIVTGSTVATNGMYLSGTNTIAFSTNSTLRLSINATGELVLGTIAARTGSSLSINKTITGSTSGWGIDVLSTIQSDVIGNARMFVSRPSTAATAFTVGEMSHYFATGVSIGAGSSVVNQHGFYVESAMNTATNNYSFRGALAASGSSRFNLYMDGTAPNVMVGRVGIGTGVTTTYQTRITNVQSTTDITLATTNFAAQTADSLAVQNSAASTVWGVTAAGLMKYIAGNTATTVGAAGGASALPATPTGYLKIDIGGTGYKVPYYAS